MKPFEDELRNALRRKEAPPGFVDRLCARLGATQGRRKESQLKKWLSLLRSPQMAWAAVGVAICLTVALGIAQYRSYQKTRVEGELAKTQLMLALKIAGQKLNFAQKKVLEIHNRGVHAQPNRDR